MPSMVVLISGSGSNLQSLIDSQVSHGMSIKAVISNKAEAYGLVRAQAAGIETFVISHLDHADRDGYDQALGERLQELDADLIVLAGFMRILTPTLVNRFLGKMINIHPSLLPHYPGLRTHARALDAGDQWHGCTVHFVIPELDAGPNIAQARLPISAADNADSLQQRVHRLEHQLYPIVVQWFAEGKLQMNSQQTWLDGQLLKPQGMVFDHE